MSGRGSNLKYYTGKVSSDSDNQKSKSLGLKNLNNLRREFNFLNRISTWQKMTFKLDFYTMGTNIKCRNQWKIEKLSLSGNLFCIFPMVKSIKLTGRFFKIVKEGVHISVHSSSITAKLPVISSEYRLLMICPSNSRFLLFVEFIDQWICELEVSFLHLWSQSICNLVTEGISGENELLANIVIWLNEIFFNNFLTK